MKTLLLFLLLACAAVAEELPLRLYSFRQSGPEISRALPQAWEWMPLGQRKAAAFASVGRSFHDEAGLTFLLEMEDPGTPTADSVEVWLRPPGSEQYRQYIVSRAGGLAIYRRTAAGADPMAAAGASVEVATRPGGWGATLRIPFAALGARVPAEGERWGFNLCRHRRGDKEELSSWASLGAFGQTARFGELAFSRRADVDADLAYWEGHKEDPHLRRSRVSGLAVAQQAPEASASFWTYDLFATDRAAVTRWGQQGLTSAAYAATRGLSGSAETLYPDLYQTADAFNRALLRLSETRLRLDELARVASYDANADLGALEKEEARFIGLEREVDALYRGYRARFPSQKPQEWAPLREEVAQFSQAVEAAHTAAIALREAWQQNARTSQPWPEPLAPLPWGEARRNAAGVPTRFWFTAYGLFGNEPVVDYFGPFRSYHVYGTFLIADRALDGEWNLPNLPIIERRFADPEQKLNFQTSVGLVSYQGPTSAWLEERIAKDPEILAVTQDRLPIPKQKVGDLDQYLRRGVNIEHPEVRAYYAEYLRTVTRPLKERLDFLVTGWEDLTEIRHWQDGKVITRQRGYDTHSLAAFRKALAERYGSIAELNRRWGGAPYASFEEITPPPDRWLSGPGKADGLHYEWARWQNRSHLEWTAGLRRAIHAEAPGLPVVTDSSHLLLRGTAWEALEAGVCDLLSFHYNPTNEDAMFAYLQSVARRKEVPLGCFENYEMMYTRLEGDDERTGARTLRRHFANLTVRDVRFQANWLRYMAHATPYVAAYGGAYFRIDTDQTLLRWPAAELLRYRRQLETTERALVESQPERGRIAVFLPDSTFLQTNHLQPPDKEEVAMARFVRLQNQLFTPASLAVEYLHEAMVEADPEELEAYTAIVVLDAAFTPRKTLAALSRWAAKPGRTLLVNGPLGFFDECGLPLAEGDSPLRAAFPEAELEPGRPWKLQAPPAAPGTPWLRRSGSVVWMTQPLDAFLSTPEKQASLLRVLEAAAPPTLRVQGVAHQLRTTAGGGRYLALRNLDAQQPQRFEVTLPAGVAHVVDIGIPGGYPLRAERYNDGSATVRGALQPGDWTVLEFTNAH